MIRPEAKANSSNSPPLWLTALYAVGIFVLALIPRVLALQHFVTADEAKWIYRSGQFLAALLQGDFAGTAVNLTPAVTTTWLGSMGLLAYYQQHQAELGQPLIEWLTSLPPFQAELPLLTAARWPMVIFTALAIAAIFLLAQRLWGSRVALLGAGLLALDPHTLALSRIIGHDAPAAMFVTLSLLALLCARPTTVGRLRWLALAGGLAGLAFLSKSPALFLLPFAGLMLLVQAGGAIKVWLQAGLVWGGIAYLVFVALWPAAWVAPLRQPYAVIENAFFSATNLDEVIAGEDKEEDSYWLVPDWGPAYYLVNGALKLSPLVTLGLLIGLIGLLQRRDRLAWQTLINNDAFWLGLFAISFLIFMTLGGKRSNRYILPIFPSLIFLATLAWSHIRVANKMISTAILGSSGLIIAVLTLVPHYPYYYTYFNPWLGGRWSAPRLVAVGWGEGLDEAGRWLNQQPQPESSRAGSWYASSLIPFYRGDVADVSSDRLDYVVMYLKQVQSGRPDPAIARYFQQLAPLHTVRLAGIDYAKIYPGPAAQVITDTKAAAIGLVAWRSQLAYAPIGQPLTLDLIWGEAVSLPDTPSRLLFQWQGVTMAQAEQPDSPFATFSQTQRYTITLPADQPADWVDLALQQGGQSYSLGSLRAFHTAPPAHFTPLAVNFGDQVALVGFDPQPRLEDGVLTLHLAWQAAPKAWADYTVFAHLIRADGERLAGFDAQPNPSTSQWAKAEVVQTSYPIALPTDLAADEPYRLRVGLYRSDTGEALGEPTVLPLELTLP
jgi:4-amino-4-deoxy-L-arabinose transferase-like glycosyltransferase